MERAISKLSHSDLKQLEKYEKQHKNRKTLLEAMKAQMKNGGSNGSRSSHHNNSSRSRRSRSKKTSPSAPRSRGTSSSSRSHSHRGAHSSSRASSGRSSNGDSVTTDHEKIRRWVEERRGHPAAVIRTESNDDPGIIRIDFPGYSGAGTLEEISWDDWFEKFDEKKLAFLHQDRTAKGKKSNFNKLIAR